MVIGIAAIVFEYNCNFFKLQRFFQFCLFSPDTAQAADGYVAEAERIRQEYLSRNSTATVAGATNPFPKSAQLTTAPPPPIRAVESTANKPTAPTPSVVVQPKAPASVAVTVRPSSAVEPPPRSTGRFSMNSSGLASAKVVTPSVSSNTARMNGTVSSVRPDDTPIPYVPPPPEFSSSPPAEASPVSAMLRTVAKPSTSNSMVFRAGRPSSGDSAPATAAGRTVVWPPKSYSERNIETWSVEEVGEWLEKLDLGDYRAAFTAHNVTGKMLKTMPESDYEKYGMSLPITRMKLQREVRNASKVN